MASLDVSDAMILKPLKWFVLCLVHAVYTAAVSVTLGLLVVLWAVRSWTNDIDLG